MKIYNTLTNKKETFESIEKGKVRMYVCGPTVYNYIHIGNARPLIVFDTVRKYFEYKNYEVIYVSNFTDIDDKIIKKANEEGVEYSEISNKYMKEFLIDSQGLNVKPATIYPKATEEIDDMIKMIEQLIEKGYAYEVNGSVYFETKKFKSYGKLSNKNQEDLEAGARIAVDTEKRNPMDFVLWKPKKEGEPAWKSPWGEGRPGWHIECSVMAKKYLGDSIDIHAGGEDLVFPHHENEIAQSEAVNDKQFSKYWMHNRFVNVDNKKMSKSLGNFFTVREIVDEFSYDVIRFFMLNVHYRSPINFSRELIQAAANGLERIRTCRDNLEHLQRNAQIDDYNEKESIFNEDKELQKYKTKFETAMEDDFNTADAISAIFELVKFANKKTDSDSSEKFIQDIIILIDELCGILGIVSKKKEILLDEDINDLIEKRQQARKDRDFPLADKIRDDLKDKGIILEDTREGVRWHRG
ncbi:cysteine--tRNA ligase [Vallitalea sp.]|jgi:cysteinyl-tRNA synthetase|uniref:cysteine--tRNA ligase n=1 Tax=Vallitalea sp. TaxID=1882829 RepID=UPI0025FC51E4|nr:cysteine--tRNA ligase [Vallitalea sp.]MCT4686429.1 cysteine--tRNA ligase [Vallitalea sp.]